MAMLILLVHQEILQHLILQKLLLIMEGLDFTGRHLLLADSLQTQLEQQSTLVEMVV
jgi:hypothetical protein